MFLARRPNIFFTKVYRKTTILLDNFCNIMASFSRTTKYYKMPIPVPTTSDTSAVAHSSCSSGSGSGHNLPPIRYGEAQKESINMTNLGRKRKNKNLGKNNTQFIGNKNIYYQLPQQFMQIPYTNQFHNFNNTYRQNYSSVSFNRGFHGIERDNAFKRYIKNNEEWVGNSIRKWEQTPLGNSLKQKNGGINTGQEFTLMSYNVLAQDLLQQHPHLYKDHNPNYLTWAKRWSSLYDEISYHRADILCLQEVQQNHMKEFYRKEFENLGYSGVYKKRTGAYTDGCAIFYNNNVFDLHESNKVDFRQPNAHRLDRDNVAIILKLAPKSNKSQEFIVATTHLLYNPKREDVRIAQIQLFLTEVERMAYKNKDEYLPIIICGDFNSEPKSSLLEFISTSSLNYNSLPIKNKVNSQYWIPHNLGVTDACQHVSLLSKRFENIKLTRKDEINLIGIHHETKQSKSFNDKDDGNFFATGTLNHKFNFKSVYDYLNDKMDGTTFQDRWICVDYIFYSAKQGDSNKKDDKLKLLSRYTLPKCDELFGVHIPNNILGSDHISLTARFKLEF